MTNNYKKFSEKKIAIIYFTVKSLSSIQLKKYKHILVCLKFYTVFLNNKSIS